MLIMLIQQVLLRYQPEERAGIHEQDGGCTQTRGLGGGGPVHSNQGTRVWERESTQTEGPARGVWGCWWKMRTMATNNKNDKNDGDRWRQATKSANDNPSSHPTASASVAEGHRGWMRAGEQSTTTTTTTTPLISPCVTVEPVNWSVCSTCKGWRGEEDTGRAEEAPTVMHSKPPPTSTSYPNTLWKVWCMSIDMHPLSQGYTEASREQTCRYPWYHRFWMTPPILWYGYGYTQPQVWCMTVWVWCGKSRPVVYLYQTLSLVGPRFATTRSRYGDWKRVGRVELEIEG